MFDVRLRIPELMAAKKVRTAYQLAKLSGGAISVTNAYRLVDQCGATDRVDMATLDALCKVFGVAPSALLTQEAPPELPKRPTRRKRAA